MDKEIIKDPQIYISKEARKLFDNMQSTLDEFKQLENKELFILALVFGYLNDKRKALHAQETEKSGFTRERYLGDQDNAILKAIAIGHNEDITLITDIPKVYSFAEEYANGGIGYLKEFVFDNPASFIKKFAALLKDEIDK